MEGGETEAEVSKLYQLILTHRLISCGLSAALPPSSSSAIGIGLSHR